MSEPSPPAVPRPKNNTWIWFFVFIFVASVGVSVFMIWFNLSIQLTPGQLEKNHNLWKEKGPRDYKLTYTKRINDDPRVEKYTVEVRDGNVKTAVMSGHGRPADAPLELDKEARVYHSMDRLFSDIDRFMSIDTKPGAKKVYVTAIFDDESTGAVRRYIRRVMGSNERVEIQATVEPIAK